MGTTKSKSTKSSSLASKAKSVASSLIKGKGSGGKRRSRGPAYWANKVLVEKLKRKYHKLKYGGR